MHTVYRPLTATSTPLPTLEPNHALCGRCGRSRRVKPGRRSSGYCGDCQPYAYADGWTTVRRGHSKGGRRKKESK